MGLIKRIFRKENGEPHSTPASTQFHESESSGDDDEIANSRNTQRRELVQVVLKDTMRKHGIPSDWIDLRMLSTTTKSGRTGMHVTFIVKQGHDRLLTYVFAFQDSFNRELARFETRASDWLLSVGWQFDGYTTPQKAVMPDPKVWINSAAGAMAPHDSAISFAPTADPLEEETRREPREEPDEETVESDSLEDDLQALFAIRDKALADPVDTVDPAAQDFEATRPGTE